MIKFMSNALVNMWHLSKISGDREIRQNFKDAQIELDDIFRLKVKTTPFKPCHLPFIFVFMDTPFMFETAF
jgi:hypothetical protein